LSEIRQTPSYRVWIRGRSDFLNQNRVIRKDGVQLERLAFLCVYDSGRQGRLQHGGGEFQKSMSIHGLDEDNCYC